MIFSLTEGTNGTIDGSVVELAKSYILYKIGKYATVTSGHMQARRAIICKQVSFSR